MTYWMTGERARWRVAWVVKRKGEIVVIEKDFEHDLNAAIELYVKAKRAGKHMATLVCCNVGFPPPERLQPHHKKVYEKKRVGKKMKKVGRLVAINPIHNLNLKGIWYCPYCRELRRFEKQDGFEVSQVLVAVEGLHCQICGASHRDGHVRKWNPVARSVTFKQTRRTSGSTGRRSRGGKGRGRRR